MTLHIHRYIWNGLLVICTIGMASAAWDVLPVVWSANKVNAYMVAIAMVVTVLTWWERRA